MERLSIPSVLIGLGIGVRFLYFLANGTGSGHIQSLILACTLIIIGFLTFMIGLVADVIAANRKILQDVQYHVKRMEYDREAPVKEDKKKDLTTDILYFSPERSDGAAVR